MKLPYFSLQKELDLGTGGTSAQLFLVRGLPMPLSPWRWSCSMGPLDSSRGSSFISPLPLFRTKPVPFYTNPLRLDCFVLSGACCKIGAFLTDFELCVSSESALVASFTEICISWKDSWRLVWFVNYTFPAGPNSALGYTCDILLLCCFAQK